MFLLAMRFYCGRIYKMEYWSFLSFLDVEFSGIKTVTVLRRPHYYTTDFYIMPNINSLLVNTNSPSSLPQLLVIFISLSASVSLSTLGTWCKGNHIVFVLPCLVYFTMHNALKFHACCSIYQSLSYCDCVQNIHISNDYVVYLKIIHCFVSVIFQ